MEEPGIRVRREGSEMENRGAGGGMTEIATLYDHMENDVDFDPAQLQIDEGMVAEVMRRLEQEINHPCGGTEVTSSFDRRLFQVVPSSSFSSPPGAAAPFVTVNGANEESCGPSFSDSASTVMASIDTRGVVGLPPLSPPGFPPPPAKDEAEIWRWLLEPAAAAGEGLAVEDTQGSDEEWLARVLSGDSVDVEPHR